MPFDISENGVALNRSLLITALRALPEDFEWDFTDSCYKTAWGSAGCAVGLAMHLGLVSKDCDEPFSEMYELLGISSRTGDSIFDPAPTRPNRYRRRMDQVSATMVAQAIEKLPTKQR